jgi:hypothetical protein
MPRTDRVLFATALALLIPLAASCGAPELPKIASCSTDEQCQADARCSDHGCVHNSAPVADFVASGELVANAVVTLDASASRDPDPGDAITAYFWTVASADAGCLLPTISSTERTVQVRFGCAGHYEVRLTVLDAKHAQSTPATRTFDVQARSGPLLVVAGPDQAVDHLCEGVPLTCRATGEIQLAATLNTTASLTVRWSVQPPPGRELGATRRVRFLPDATSLSPKVEIETDGTAISGDWSFRVEVQDGVGVLDADVTRVSVANRPPVIQGGPSGTFEHRYLADSRFFTASGSFPAVTTDPDGDPVTRQLSFHHTGDGAGAFQGLDLGAAIGFLVTVPLDGPGAGQNLIGGENLRRSVVLDAADANGAPASTTFEVTLSNRPPARTVGADPVTNHGFDVTAYQFVSTPSIGQWADPDGDPLQFEVVADEDCPGFTVDAGGIVRLQCALAGSSTLSYFLRNRSATVTAADPWSAAAVVGTFRIGNRSPVVSPPAIRPAISCSMGTATTINCSSTRFVPGNTFGPVNALAPQAASDPDGDPIELQPVEYAVGGVCGAGSPCSLRLNIPQTVSCSTVPLPRTIQYSASDGATTVAGALSVEPTCR